MIRAFFLALLLTCSASSFAARVPMRPPSNVSSGTSTLDGLLSQPSRSTVGQVASDAQKFSGPFSVPVGGVDVPIPAVWPIAETAAKVAAQAVKLNPARLAVGVVAVWLAEKGLQYVDGQWQKYVQGQRVGLCHPAYAPDVEGIDNAACMALTKSAIESHGCYNVVVTPLGPNPDSQTYQTTFNWPGGGSDVKYVAGWTFAQATPPKLTPATPSDWTPAETSPLPDPVINDLTGKGVGLPVGQPQVSVNPEEVPLGAPYNDTQTGHLTQDVASVTASSDGTSAEVQIKKRQVDANGNPVIDPSTGQPTKDEAKQDFCAEHPDVLSCLKVGEPPAETPVDTKEKQVSITPDSGWGASNGTCPADLVHVTGSGFQIKLTYKPICQGATILRPLIIGLGWLSAAILFVGISRRVQG